MPKRGAPRELTFRRRAYFALEGGNAGGLAGSIVEFGLIAFIIANVIAFTLQSEPPIRRAFPAFFTDFEGISIAIFTIEYLTRLWCAPEDPLFRGGLFLGRLRFALRPMMMIDFLAFAPGYIAFFVPFVDLRFLRLVRLLRLLKIARYSPALSTLAQVIVDERRALVGTLLLELCAMVFAAATMHAVEGNVNPQAFGTIPDAMWWALETLTTIGYGDLVPTTPMGKIIGGFVMVIGVVAVALFTSVITVSFMDQLRLRREALQNAAKGSLADGVLTAGELDAIEQLGHRLGLPPADVAEAIVGTAREMGSLAACPHCGGLLAHVPLGLRRASEQA